VSEILTSFTINLLLLTDCQNVNDPTSVLWSVISVSRCEVDENCAVLFYYAGSSGNLLPTFRDQFLPKPRWWITNTPCVITQNNAVFFSSTILTCTIISILAISGCWWLYTRISLCLCGINQLIVFWELKHNGMSSFKIQEAKKILIYSERWLNDQLVAQLHYIIRLLL